MSSRLVTKSGSIRPLASILYSDKKCIVLQKPPGLVCQLRQNEGNHLNDFNLLLRNLRDTFGQQPVPVHRLDKGTTGALVLGRSVMHARALSQQFQARTVEKTYLALVRGGAKSFPTKSGEIGAPIQYEDGRASLDPSAGGKPSITGWEVISSSPSVPLSLLRLKLHTGHKHQLRLHLAHCLGAPILGDTQYSRKPIAEAIRNLTAIPENRIFLHASHVSLFQYRPTGPKKRLRLGITAPLPSDFLKICYDSGIQVDAPDAHGGLWSDGLRVKDGYIPDLEGTWVAGRS